ncbi:hypothetical protein [Streptomyces sp. NBC_00878]|uniref:hypothetical protein n=1 Tax=Streptomyces sp. NBC_00878 TaxID=2975854 RepID=UPI002251CAC1|nr:hypothetical protein [Streptomyces sp. NBC_00878]MCX4903714.1 hypothetical protein [Streptomyces sp. NBC_00878]
MSNLIHRRRSAVLAGVGTAAALSLLAACGGGSGGDGNTSSEDKGVASLDSPSAGGGSSTASADADAGRPQLRLDTSEAERARLTGIYFDCLHEKGVPGGRKPGASHFSPAGDAAKYPAAYKACQSKNPLQPPEQDPAKNPHYADDYRDYIKCLNDGGLKVHALPDNAGWTYDSSVPTMSASAQDKLDRTCTLKAFQ